ncbi:uncharacterized protein LOC100199826 isoform X2 [Hydra vulgaris]|uniref:Large ribosomal subunit protein bL17m n=1 Tax=Hydra vulgaris TaxID=6087 RepID=A0ABM4B821_HYDVU
MSAGTIINKNFAFSKIVLPSLISCRQISITNPLSKKRRNISKWKNSFPSTVYTEVDLEERCFDNILDTKTKNRFHRRNMFKLLLDRLITHERVVVTYVRGKGLARLTELLFDFAKNGNEPAVYSLMHRKELVPRVFKDLLPRFENLESGYTQMYHLQSEAIPQVRRGRLLHHIKGNAVVELVGNDLPPLLPTEEELQKLTFEYMMKKKESIDNIRRGTCL